jgi:hypothetical protein
MFVSTEKNFVRSLNVSVTEKLILAIILISVLSGMILGFQNRPVFLKLTEEDGIVEWLTVAGLLAAAFTCFRRVLLLRRSHGRVFLLVTFLLGLILFFGAGEEISWGQRIFGLQSPEYFKEHNAQGETNIHNLVLGGVRLNRWIFSILLSVILVIYIGVIPFLYRTKQWMRRFVNYFAVPLPQNYQIIAFIVVIILTEIIPDGKRAELTEEGTALLLFLITAFPLNKKTFEATAA